MGQVGDRKGDVKISPLHRHSPRDDSLVGLRGLSRYLLRRRGSRRNTREEGFDLGEDLLGLEVTDPDEDQVRTDVPPPVKIEEMLPRDAANRFPVARDRPPVGVDQEGFSEQVLTHHLRRVVLGTGNLLHDYFLLAGQFRLVEGRVGRGIGQDIQADLHTLGRHVDVEDRFVKTGVGVNVPTRGLHLLGDLSDGTPPGPFEDHVFDQVTDSRLAVGLVGAPDVCPEIPGNDRGGVALEKNHPESVGQCGFERFVHGRSYPKAKSIASSRALIFEGAREPM